MNLSLPTQKRIDDIRTGLGTGDGSADQDLKDVAIEALEHVGRSHRVPELDADLIRRSALYLNALKDAVA